MEVNEMAQDVWKRFESTFEGTPIIVRSPGRVNIIGEHTDYNEGFVLPAAIDKAAYVAVGKRDDDLIRLYSEHFAEMFECRLDALQPTDKGWPNYVLGVADQMIKRGHPIKGFNLVLNADVPIGAGLSSSAAVECATAYVLNEIFDLDIDKIELVKISQIAEHTFAGVMCGIMDQFASMHGKKDHVIKLDCRTLEFEYVPLKMEGYKLLLLNTNVKHALGDSEYNTRRQQCEAGVALIKKHHPEVASLRDVTPQMLQQYVAPANALIYRRCKYVVEENIRLLTGCEDLKRGDIKALGQKMFETHEGLSKEYEVSCKELDFLVDYVKGHEAVLGARMMGGGFGGCTINIIKQDAIDDLVKNIAPAYEEAMQLKLAHYIAVIEDGTTQIYN